MGRYVQVPDSNKREVWQRWIHDIPQSELVAGESVDPGDTLW
jgi:hypothetical protein